MPRGNLLTSIFIVAILFIGIPGGAETLSWSYLGAGYWDESDYWYPAQAPTAGDEVYIDMESASVINDTDFAAGAVTVGGKYSSYWTIADSVFGTIDPGVPTDPAVILRRGGYITVEGTGVLTMKGSLYSSDELLTPEPSFMFWSE
ncbi:MAG: hypothetical protein JXD21_00935 [Candidatus Omnitrophica bacterium]|nr:hypothetical protein [Candidatus Omnitrophota bacterium]